MTVSVCVRVCLQCHLPIHPYYHLLVRFFISLCFYHYHRACDGAPPAPVPSARGQSRALRRAPSEPRPRLATPSRLETVGRPREGCPRAPQPSCQDRGQRLPSWRCVRGVARRLGFKYYNFLSLLQPRGRRRCPRPRRRPRAGPMPIYANWAQPPARAIFGRAFATAPRRRRRRRNGRGVAGEKAPPHERVLPRPPAIPSRRRVAQRPISLLARPRVTPLKSATRCHNAQLLHMIFPEHSPLLQ